MTIEELKEIIETLERLQIERKRPIRPCVKPASDEVEE